MSFSSADIPEIKWSLSAFIASLVLAVLLFNVSDRYKQNALADKKSAQEQLAQARTQLAAAQDDYENMATYKLEYETLESQKVIGNEQRLDWMEGLDKIRKQGLVKDFKYTIAPQQNYTPAPPLASGNFDLRLSPMTLQIDLLHEEQLSNLFSAISSQMQGWFILERCELSSGETPTSGLSSLKADCTGGWLTMKNRNTP